MTFKKIKVFGVFVRCGVRTHAPVWEPELKSGALDRSANLTTYRVDGLLYLLSLSIVIFWLFI